MDVTSEMTAAAVKVAVKYKILPTHADMDAYIHRYEAVEKMIEAALSASLEDK